MPRHLLLRLQAPLIAFGGETIDNFGVIRRFPALSMVTGLLANALGYDRSETDLHNRLQARLVIGTRLEAEGRQERDYQTARLNQDDKGWTTSGSPEGREPSPSYSSDQSGRKSLTLQRYRDYHADLHALIALRLRDTTDTPTLDDLALALDRPARPLFVGRKPCLPTCRLFAGWCEADSVLSALAAQPKEADVRLAVQWPAGEGVLPGMHASDLCDERNWLSGVHGGWRPVLEGRLPTSSAEGAGQ